MEIGWLVIIVFTSFITSFLTTIMFLNILDGVDHLPKWTRMEKK